MTTDSGGTGGPDCTLRDAITAANTDSASGGCPAGDGADVIDLPTGAVIEFTTWDEGSPYLDGCWSGLPSITSEIEIHGNTAVVRRSAPLTPAGKGSTKTKQ